MCIPFQCRDSQVKTKSADLPHVSETDKRVREVNIRDLTTYEVEDGAEGVHTIDDVPDSAENGMCDTEKHDERRQNPPNLVAKRMITSSLLRS